MISNRISAVLFDLDGTLIDTAYDLHYALDCVLCLHKHKPTTLEKVKPFVSYGVLAMLKGVLGERYEQKKLNQYHQEILAVYAQNIAKFSVYFTGMEQTISQIQLQKIKWGIVTNKPKKFTNLLLKSMNIKPDVAVSGDTCEYNKPHPQPLLYACRQLNISPVHTLFVGDDIKDMQAGRNAGVKTVAVSYGYGLVDANWQYNFLIDKPNDLLKIIATTQ